MILRELISRFGFEIKNKDVSEYNKTIDSMSKKAVKLAGIFGVGFSLKGLLDIGKSTKQASEDLKRMAGTDFDKFKSSLTSVRSKLDNVREGAGEIVRDKVFNNLATGFIESFGKGEKQIENFTQLLESAALQSAATGKSVSEIFTGYTDSIKSGDFSSLMGMKGFDIQKKNKMEFIQNAIDPGEPGGRIGRENRMSAILKVLGEYKNNQQDSVRGLDPTLFHTEVLKRRSQDKGEETSENANTAVAPVVRTVNDVLSNLFKLNKESFLGKTDSQGKTDAGKSWGSIVSDIGEMTVGNTSRFIQNYKKENGYVNPSNKRKPLGPQSQQQSSMQVNAEFNIKSDDPRAVAAVVDKRLNETIKKARNQIIKN